MPCVHTRVQSQAIKTVKNQINNKQQTGPELRPVLFCVNTYSMIAYLLSSPRRSTNIFNRQTNSVTHTRCENVQF